MRIPLTVLLLGVWLSAPARAEDLDRRIPAQPGGQLELYLDRGEGLRPDPGDVEVWSHDADEVRILVERSGWGASGVRFRIEQNGDTVRVSGGASGALSWMFGGPKVDVRVWVPRRFSVDLRCSAGSVRIEDVTGGVRARTADGAVELSAIQGRARVRVANGGIRVSEVSGDVDLKTSGGDLELAWIEGQVEARTDAGRIEASHLVGSATLRTDAGSIRVHDIEGSLDAQTERGGIYASFVGTPTGSLETSRGSVDVRIPRDAGAALDARTRSGEVEIAPGLAVARGPAADAVSGDLNGGGPPLRLYTAQGEIRLGAR